MNEIQARIAGGHLPTWDQMSDPDKGAALLHQSKRISEGIRYATENHPPCYTDDPRLLALDSNTASDHAAAVCTPYVFVGIGADEYERLRNLALTHARGKRN